MTREARGRQWVGSLWVVLVAASACTKIQLEVPRTAVIACQVASDCPDDLVCVSAAGACHHTDDPCVTLEGDGYVPTVDGIPCSHPSGLGICLDAACVASTCGDGVVDTQVAHEACDDGRDNSDTRIDACRTDCQAAHCGDGVVDSGEECDDGNDNDLDSCSSTCLTNCGDGILQAGEACDDHNRNDGDGCDSNCTVTACGNGIQSAGEACDDGDLVDGNGCDSNCTVTACGNGIRTSGEACDDANLVDGDGCDSDCTRTGCGNGIVTAGEECDDGNFVSGDGCDDNCTLPRCGNGVIAGTETCDDGNERLDDDCPDGPLGTCQVGACGDGFRVVLTTNPAVPTEPCDDGNLVDGDGCSTSCAIETGFICTGNPTSSCTPICGDGLVRGDEPCDDGNAIDGDGCTACQVDPGYGCDRLDPSTCVSVCYVWSGATGANDGTSWADAYTELTSALAATTCGEIWVAEGTYTPSAADRAATFGLHRAVSIFGGYTSASLGREDRDWQLHPVVLSGDLAGDDGAAFTNRGDNSYHVLDVRDPAPSGGYITVRLDGFVVRGGYADDSPTSTDTDGGGLRVSAANLYVTRVRFEDNSALGYFSGTLGGGSFGGGGMSINSLATVELRDVHFVANRAGTYNNGGGLCVAPSNTVTMIGGSIEGNTAYSGAGLSLQGPGLFAGVLFLGNSAGNGAAGAEVITSGEAVRFLDCVFDGNASGANTGAVEISNSAFISPSVCASPRFTNCTFVGNTAASTPQAVIRGLTAAAPIVYNSIFWGNQATSAVLGSVATPCPAYLTIQSTLTGSNPLLDAQYSPTTGSPAIDVGNSSELDTYPDVYDLDGDGDTTEPWPVDYLGQARVHGTSVDIGAVESQL